MLKILLIILFIEKKSVCDYSLEMNNNIKKATMRIQCQIYQ